MYVSNAGNDTVSIIRSSDNMIISIINVGNRPIGIAYNPDNQNMYVSNAGNDTLSVIDSTTNTVIDTVTVEDEPIAIAYNPDNGYMYETSVGDNTISVIRSDNIVIYTIMGVDEPYGIAYNPDNGYMYVANNNANTVTVIGEESLTPPASPEPKTIGELLRSIIQNPLYVTNSIDSANQIRDILTDNYSDNDKLVCDLIKGDNQLTSNIREILKC
ncbi:conserved protein of unknown function [Candidatus Nitrosocosmicus franklandus]|uniref:YNCE-like beta-propeller domain-containing protein n=2 Tax=Candidatus Nitrosocosmicus franklandianus TaxID=1798806 RepID=A0A484I6Q8_9ARCH|nr:conserved protein of unknown function [Candidatus Nitrosocosmicus franklandus]